MLGWRLQGVGVRLIAVAAASLLAAQCTTPREQDLFRVGSNANALIVIGVAEAAEAQHPEYAVLWRQIDERTGAFEQITARRMVEARTNSSETLRVAGLPGEFTVVEVEPGVYALDSVFATIPDGRVTYIAPGLIEGPERPSFEARRGEAVYLGIWEASLVDHSAVVRPWRLTEEDTALLSRATGRTVIGGLTPRETTLRAAPCTPRYLSSFSQRQIC
ncbi:MAG: hypothetical protein JNK94_01075 [Hyphomonadaceae bacterium]|nr:hypothetical protein [Hyphomonadaceae bacterium]